MSMRSFFILTAAILVISTALAAQPPVPPQNPAGQTPDQTIPADQKPKSTDPTRKPDAIEQRDKEIQKYDPLAKPADEISPDPRYATGIEKTPGQFVDATVSGAGDLAKEYTGPAVLTRTYAVERPSVPENTKFRPFVGVNAIYDSGLTGVVVRPDGTVDNSPSFGTMITFGFDGRHYWRHDIVQVSYSGNVNRYTPASGYDGSNHVFAFDWTHALNRHLRVSLVSNVSHYSMNYNLTNPQTSPDINVANVNLATTPNIQIFDNSTNQVSNAVSLTWQKSSRLSFNFSGSYFFIKRAGNGLIGSEGVQGGNDVSYRLTKKTTLGGFYSYTYYRFSHNAGNTTSNTFGLIYSYAFDARTELRTRIGVDVLQNLGITSVSIDPVIAALLGQSAATVQFYSTSKLLDVSASLTRQLRGGRTMFVAYNQGTTPGNGVFVASKQQVIDFGYSASLSHRFRVSTTAGRSALSSLSQAVGHYTSENLHFEVSRPIQRSISGNLGFDYRRFQITASPLLRDQYRVTLGFTWSNPDFPSRIF